MNDRPRFIIPRWPDEEFVLLAERGEFELGPFTADAFDIGPDNALERWPPDGSHPIHLRVSLQVGDLLVANNGDMGPMTFRIVPASAYRGGKIGDLALPGDPFEVGRNLAELLHLLDEEPLGHTISALEEQLGPLSIEDPASFPGQVASLPKALEAALLVSKKFDRLSDVIRSLTIALVLPRLLEADEGVLTCSLRTPRPPSTPFDLETDRRVARFRLTRPIGSRIDRRGLLADLAALAADETGRSAELYVIGEWAGRFLAESEIPMRDLLGQLDPTPDPFGQALDDTGVSIAEFRAGAAAAVRVIDLGPELNAIFTE